MIIFIYPVNMAVLAMITTFEKMRLIGIQRNFFEDLLSNPQINSLILITAFMISPLSKKINHKTYLYAITFIHCITYALPIYLFHLEFGYFPKQLSNATTLVIDSTVNISSLLRFSLFFILFAMLFLIFSIRLYQTYQQVDKQKASISQYAVLALCFMPLFIEWGRYAFNLPIPSYLAKCLFITCLSLTFCLVIKHTASTHLKNDVHPCSTLSFFVFKCLVVIAMLSIMTNIRGIILANKTLAEMHGTLAAFSYLLFFVFLYTLKPTSWYCSLLLLVSALVSFLFLSTSQVNEAPTISLHTLYEFCAFGCLYAAFIIQTTTFANRQRSK